MPAEALVTASTEGIINIAPEIKKVLGAQDIVNLLPRQNGLELRKGFRYYKTIPPSSVEINDETIVLDRPPKLFKLDRHNPFADEDQSWSMLFAISKIPYAIELQTNNEEPALTDYEVVGLTGLGQVTRDGITPADRQDFPNPQVTEYTDLLNNKNIVVCSDQTTFTTPEGVINGMWTIQTRQDQSTIRSPIEATYVPTVLSTAGRNDLEEWSNEVIYRPGDQVIYRNKPYVMIATGAVAIQSDNPPDVDTTNWQESTEILLPISTDKFSFSIFHDNRLFFLEQGNNLVYWTRLVNENPTTETIMNKFKIGYTEGTNLFATVLSTDTSDAGPNKWLVFVSTEGEVHIYPQIGVVLAENTVYRGRFKIGRPLGGKESFMEIEGDVLVATEWGLISIKTAMQKEAIIGKANMANQIVDDWRKLVEKTKDKGDWFIQKDPTFEKTMIIHPAGENYSYIYCIDTQAFTKIDKAIQSTITYADQILYAKGHKVSSYEQGQDTDEDGVINPINFRWLPRPALGQSTLKKTIVQARLNYTSTNRVAHTIFINDYYSPRFPASPTPIPYVPPSVSPIMPGDVAQTNIPVGQFNDLKDLFGQGNLIAPGIIGSVSQEHHPELRLTSISTYSKQGRAL